MFEDEKLLKAILKEATDTGETITDEECKKRSKQKGLALELLKSSKHKSAINEVRTQYLYKHYVYPTDLAEAFEIIEHHARRHNKKPYRKPKASNTEMKRTKLYKGF